MLNGVALGFCIVYNGGLRPPNPPFFVGASPPHPLFRGGSAPTPRSWGLRPQTPLSPCKSNSSICVPTISHQHYFSVQTDFSSLCVRTYVLGIPISTCFVVENKIKGMREGCTNKPLPFIWKNFKNIFFGHAGS